MSGNSRILEGRDIHRDMETIDPHSVVSSVVEEGVEPEKGGGEKKSEWFESTALSLRYLRQCRQFPPVTHFGVPDRNNLLNVWKSLSGHAETRSLSNSDVSNPHFFE